MKRFLHALLYVSVISVLIVGVFTVTKWMLEAMGIPLSQ